MCQELTKWNTLIRTTTFIFERLQDIKSMFWRSLNLRESAHGLYKACIRTAFQRIIEITMFRHSEDKIKGKHTHAQIWQEYNLKLPSATAPTAKEQVTETMISQVHLIYTKHFTETVMKTVQAAERRATPLVIFCILELALCDIIVCSYSQSPIDKTNACIPCSFCSHSAPYSPESHSLQASRSTVSG